MPMLQQQAHYSYRNEKMTCGEKKKVKKKQTYMPEENNGSNCIERNVSGARLKNQRRVEYFFLSLPLLYVSFELHSLRERGTLFKFRCIITKYSNFKVSLPPSLPPFSHQQWGCTGETIGRNKTMGTY